MSAETVEFGTEDGVVIVGDAYRGEGKGPAALLLHMMPADRSSWRTFATSLLDAGFSLVLAIDERGHGASVRGPEGRTLDFKTFSDEEQQRKRLDVEAAVAWVRERAPDAALVVVGASIGANLAIAYGAAHPDVAATVALSPGLDYRGVTTAEATDAHEGRPLFLAASGEDEYSAETVRALAARRPDAAVRMLTGAGHGTTMFERDPSFMREVVEWTAAAVGPRR